MYTKRKESIQVKAGIKISKKYYLYFFVLGIFVVAHIFLALETVAYGSKLATLEHEGEQLERQNKSMELEYVTSTSLLKLKEDISFYYAFTISFVNWQHFLRQIRILLLKVL